MVGRSVSYLIKLKLSSYYCEGELLKTSAAQSKGGELKYVQPGSFKEQNAAWNSGSCSLFTNVKFQRAWFQLLKMRAMQHAHIRKTAIILLTYSISATDKQVFVSAKATGNIYRCRYQEVMFHSWGGIPAWAC